MENLSEKLVLESLEKAKLEKAAKADYELCKKVFAYVFRRLSRKVGNAACYELVLNQHYGDGDIWKVRSSLSHIYFKLPLGYASSLKISFTWKEEMMFERQCPEIWKFGKRYGIIQYKSFPFQELLQTKIAHAIIRQLKENGSIELFESIFPDRPLVKVSSLEELMINVDLEQRETCLQRRNTTN